MGSHGSIMNRVRDCCYSSATRVLKGTERDYLELVVIHFIRIYIGHFF